MTFVLSNWVRLALYHKTGAPPRRGCAARKPKQKKPQSYGSASSVAEDQMGNADTKPTGVSVPTPLRATRAVWHRAVGGSVPMRRRRGPGRGLGRGRCPGRCPGLWPGLCVGRRRRLSVQQCSSEQYAVCGALRMRRMRDVDVSTIGMQHGYCCLLKVF